MNEAKVVCNVCGKAFDELDRQENFGFDYHVGYGSRYDLSHLKAHICIDCFDKLMDRLIPLCKISPDQGEYALRGEEELCAEDFPAEEHTGTPHLRLVHSSPFANT